MPENTEAEANLRGHLKPENTESASQGDDSSSSYVPQEKDKDTQLQYALDLVRAGPWVAGSLISTRPRLRTHAAH
jgi:carboxyl-terminal processing protease